MPNVRDYLAEARDDARETANYFEDEIVEALIDEGEADDHLLNGYTNGDSYHHENHVDKSYSLFQAANLLSDLSYYEETDWGLWEGVKEPERAIAAKAAYTYGNAVLSLFSDLIGEINEDEELALLLGDYKGVEDKVRAELEEDEARCDNENYEPPFDEAEEVEKRQGKIKGQILERVRTIVREF